MEAVPSTRWCNPFGSSSTVGNPFVAFRTMERIFGMYTPPQDKALHQGCLAGEPAAQRALYERFRTDMFRVCLRYAGCREEAEDFLQEGFITAFRDLHQFRGDGPLGGWLRRVMVHTALQALRKKRLQFSELDERMALPDLSAYGGMVARLDAEHLTRLLQVMPTGYRTVFNLVALEGYGHEEVAGLLGISASTSKTQLFKARQWLQARLPASLVQSIA